MIVLLGFALLALIFTAVLGGSIRGLERLQLKGETFLLVLFVAQAFARGRLVSPLSASLRWNPVIVWSALSALLLVVLIVNARTLGLPLMALGVTLNLAVVLLNGGMPVPASQIGRMTYGGFYTVGSRLSFLGDVIPGPMPGLLFSPGDIALFAGAFLVVVAACALSGRAADG